jgi:hypothetical protein
VTRHSETLAGGFELAGQLVASAVVTYRHNDGVVFPLRQVRDLAEHTNTEEVLPFESGSIVQVSCHFQIRTRVGHSLQDVGDDLAMAASSQD